MNVSNCFVNILNSLSKSLTKNVTTIVIIFFVGSISDMFSLFLNILIYIAN